MKRLFSPFTIVLLLSLTACSQLAVLGNNQSSQNEKLEKARLLVGASKEKAEKLEETEALQKKEFRPDTLYALMIAEIALERDMPDLALSYYRREAYKTRDPGVIKRSLEISSWLEAHKVSLELMTLWREVEPENPLAHSVMAQQQLYFGKVLMALDSVDQVLALEGDFNFDYFNQVVPDLDESQKLAVLRKLDYLSEEHSGNSQVWLSKAHLYGLLDQRQNALEAASRAKRLNNSNDRALIMHAELQFNYNNHNKALREMQRGLRKFPDSKPLHFLYAQSLLKMGELKKAKKEIDSSVEHFEGEYEFHFRLAGLSAKYGLNETAEFLFQKSIAERYREREAFFFLSELSENRGDITQAIAYLNQLRPGPGFLEARLQMAYLLNEQGKLEQAIESLTEARFLQSDQKGILYQAQADLLSKAGKKQEALEVYHQAVIALPLSTDIRYARSMLAESMDRIDITEQDLLKIIDMEPDNAMALNALGYTLTDKTDRHEEALVYIERAYAIEPNDPAIIDSMGWVHYQLGNYQEAISYLRKAIALQADHEIAAHLGEVLWVSGERDEALAIWDEALANNKNSKVLKSVMERFISKQP